MLPEIVTLSRNEQKSHYGVVNYTRPRDPEEFNTTTSLCVVP